MNDVVQMILGFAILASLLISLGLWLYPENMPPEESTKNKRWLKLFGLKPINGNISCFWSLWFLLGWYFLVAGSIGAIFFGRRGAVIVYYSGIAILCLGGLVLFFIGAYRKKE